ELLEYRLFDNDALRRDALLAARLEGRRHDADSGVSYVGIGADDIGRVAAELSDEWLGARRFRQRMACRRAAGQGHQRYVRVAGKPAGYIAPAGDYIDEPVGNTRPAEAFGDQQRFSDPFEGGLDDDRIAHGDGRRDFLHEKVRRRVERRERCDHAVGQPLGEAEPPRPHGQRIERQYLALHAQQLLRAEPQELRRAPDLDATGAARLAEGAHGDRGDLVLDLVDLVGSRAQPGGALRRGPATMGKKG